MATDPIESEEFSPEISAAFAAYPAPNPSKRFEARFWNQLDARRSRYQGFVGFWRRVWELEIEGVVVWRLAASALSGGLSCIVVLGALGSTPSTKVAPLPLPSAPPVANLTAFAFYNREWERDFSAPNAVPKTAPPRRLKNEKEFSWNVSSAGLA